MTDRQHRKTERAAQDARRVLLACRTPDRSKRPGRTAKRLAKRQAVRADRRAAHLYRRANEGNR